MSKLYADIYRMMNMLNIIEQYNNFKQLGASEDIDYLKDKVKNLYNIKDTEKLIEDFKYCADMVNMYYNEVSPDFKQYILKEQQKENEE